MTTFSAQPANRAATPGTLLLGAFQRLLTAAPAAPAERMYRMPGETRRYLAPHESTVAPAAPEPRRYTPAQESRILAVDGETRVYQVPT